MTSLPGAPGNGKWGVTWGWSVGHRVSLKQSPNVIRCPLRESLAVQVQTAPERGGNRGTGMEWEEAEGP